MKRPMKLRIFSKKTTIQLNALSDNVLKTLLWMLNGTLRTEKAFEIIWGHCEIWLFFDIIIDDLIYWRKISYDLCDFIPKKLTCRILNICFDFFNCPCLWKATTNIENSTRSNQWVAMDIRKLFLAFISRILLFWQFIYI